MLNICVSLQGLIALLSNSAFMLALHVILGAMLGAALSAHNENIFLQQQFKYDNSLVFPAFACNGTTHACTSPPQALHRCLFILFSSLLCAAMFGRLTLLSSSPTAWSCLRHSTNLLEDKRMFFFHT